MSRRAYVSRYVLILKKLRSKPYASLEELQQYINASSGHLQLWDETLNMAFSKRTLQRDLREIRVLFGIDIEYSKREKGYFISPTERDNKNFERLLEALDLFNSLNIAEDLAPFICLEKNNPGGTENLQRSLHAIKNRLQVRFTYHKFWEEEVSHRVVEPYALKEFKNRWYIIAEDIGDGCIKSFALDRMTDLCTTAASFEYPEDFSIEEHYRYSFGIINPNGNEPEDIVLSFDPYQGKYIKSLPLHHTQQILVDTKEELRIKLRLHITHDLVMELLSFGDSVTVIKPGSLINMIRDTHKNAFKLYGN